MGDIDFIFDFFFEVQSLPCLRQTGADLRGRRYNTSRKKYVGYNESSLQTETSQETKNKFKIRNEFGKSLTSEILGRLNGPCEPKRYFSRYFTPHEQNKQLGFLPKKRDGVRDKYVDIRGTRTIHKDLPPL